MQACLVQARLAKPLCTPNPAVGAVLVDSSNRVIGVGHTQLRGGPHAEIMAMRDAAAKGFSPKGATLFVSLEPCSHVGRTGPCTDALVGAGIAKVFASMRDPNPLVSGQGFEKLRAAGIEVDIGLGALEALELNIGFLSRMIRKRPWVRMKVAASLDGKTALENGCSQWITSDAARLDGHHWRARACAILTGIGTVIDDNPRLDARIPGTFKQPTLILVDSRLDVPLDAQIFEPDRPVIVYTTCNKPDKRAVLEARGVTVVNTAMEVTSANGKVDLAAMLADLAAREINELHVEAGHKLNGSLVKAGLVDEFLIYLAPIIMGLGLPMASFGPLLQLTDAVQFDFISCKALPPDIQLTARAQGWKRIFSLPNDGADI